MARSPKRLSQADKRCFRDRRHSRGVIPAAPNLALPAGGLLRRPFVAAYGHGHG
jgi:hypothetical protein